MGDQRHKKSPPDDPEEDITEAFRYAARRRLELNDENNRVSELKKGERGYLISSHAELAAREDIDPSLLNRIIGPAKPGTPVKLLKRSVYVGRIRRALALPAVTQLIVPVSRVPLLKTLAEMPEDRFVALEEAIRERENKRKRESSTNSL